MIIRSIKLHNFGIYGGDNTFDLIPKEGERYHRPIILFRGKNGVGKTTLVEAIRLCLHGRLSLGNRSRQRDYEAYLKRRLNRSASGEIANHAFVQLEFDHVTLGRQNRYRVNRSWQSHGQNISSTVEIWIDEVAISDDEEEKEYLLRELVPAGVAELFFFDGEKMATLSEGGEASDALLAETVKNLLGLHLVEQLDRDLDIYLTRQTGARELKEYQDVLEQLHQEGENYQHEHEEVRAQLTDCRQNLNKKRKEIALLEDKIAHEGGSYAEREKSFGEERQQLNESVTQIEQEIQELSRQLLPFSVAPKLLTAIRDRLLQEAQYDQWQASQSVLSDVKQRIIREVTKENYWVGIANPPDKEGQEKHIQKITQLLKPYEEAPMVESEVIHRVSSEKRGVLLNWIDEALTTMPHQLAIALKSRETLQSQLAAIDEGLSRVPLSEILEPLRQKRLELERDLGRLEGEQERLEAEDKRLAYHLERNVGSKRRVSEQILKINTDEDRIKLAARTKLLLDEYQRRLTKRKLEQLANQLVKRFNQLSRKRNFIDKVIVDPETFHISLYQAGKLIPRGQLSAGEDQIFAVATLWALREVSSRPLPVIIDTPLSRLDDEHRQTMLTEFMPQVAHQVVVLATTTEIDDETYSFMQPAVSKAYLLSERLDGATTEATEQFVEQQTSLIALEEVVANATE